MHSRDVQDSSLTGDDVKAGSIRSTDLEPQVRTRIGTVPFVEYASAAQPVPSGVSTTVTSECPGGFIVVGGHVEFEDPANGTLQGSGPLSGDDIGWFVFVENTGGGSQLVTAVAHCANIGG